ncbi:MAG: malate dehydrogenase [Gammaproteobacteria bacterium]|nr:malate dehydrogenase [Gammaproteobacteria bacterium]MDH3447136.1 malate dehydrogenase [Gammaproteobacteria bacterium]
MKVCVLGAAGGIGQPLSLLLKLQLPAASELALYDVAPFTPGVAVDLSHIPTDVCVTGYVGDDVEAAMKDADIVVIPAGVPRKPGMTRDDLFNVNAGIVKNLVGTGSKACPNACFAIVTNPVNSTVPIAAEVLKAAGVYDKRRLFGVTTLDVIRSNTFVAQIAGKSTAEVNVNVIGGHSGVTILPLLSSISGVKLSQADIEALTPRIQEAGTEVVEAKAGAGSATLSMAHAATRFTMSLVAALNGESVTECCYVQVGDDSMSFHAQPVVLGRHGVDSIPDLPPLSDYEQKLRDEMRDILDGNIKKGIEFANAK